MKTTWYMKTTCTRIRKKGYQLAGQSNTHSIRRWISSSSGGGRDTCMRASAQVHTARTTRPEIKQSAWLHAVAAGSLHLDLLRVWDACWMLCTYVSTSAGRRTRSTWRRLVCVPRMTKGGPRRSRHVRGRIGGGWSRSCTAHRRQTHACAAQFLS